MKLALTQNRPTLSAVQRYAGAQSQPPKRRRLQVIASSDDEEDESKEASPAASGSASDFSQEVRCVTDILMILALVGLCRCCCTWTHCLAPMQKQCCTLELSLGSHCNRSNKQVTPRDQVHALQEEIIGLPSNSDADDSEDDESLSSMQEDLEDSKPSRKRGTAKLTPASNVCDIVLLPHKPSTGL